jgi:hypothetical protein
MSGYTLSDTILLWLFGRWAFDGAGPDQISPDHLTEVTPLVIFASYFTTVGLAMFGLLGAWAIFLGIFRLRQNGNFFGAKDANESFFYPMRMVFAMALCAPVILVASPGGERIILTPGHAMIASIAKQGSSWGDEAQKASFKALNTYLNFENPDYKVQLEPGEVDEMVEGMLKSASGVASTYIIENSQGALPEYANDPVGLANMIIRERWNRANPLVQAAGTPNTNPFVAEILRKSEEVEIYPDDAVAAAYADASAIAERLAPGTAAAEQQSESILCDNAVTGMTFCSEEQEALHKANQASINKAIARLQRTAYSGLVALSYPFFIAQKNGTVTAAEIEQMKLNSQEYIRDLKKWYKQSVEAEIRTVLATDQTAAAQDYMEGVGQWGWMVGGTFVMRAANDFSRISEYSSDATPELLPKADLASLTVSDSLSKVVLQDVENTARDTEGVGSTAEFFGLAILNDDPADANLESVANFGRGLAGTGVMLIGGSAIGKIGLAGALGKAGSKMMFLFGAAMLFAGGLIGYVLPIVFAIYGLMGAISWITFTASAFFGVTLWSAAFAAPKGEEHTSQMAAKGWNMLIFIGLYPALAVGGLAAAITLTNLALPLVNMTMSGMWGMMDNGVADWTQPFDALAGVLIGSLIMVLATCFLFWTVCTTSASLITSFPRTVLNMVSFSEPGLNPYEQAGQGVMQGVGGIVKAPLSMAASTAGGAIVRGVLGLGRGNQANPTTKAGGT